MENSKTEMLQENRSCGPPEREEIQQGLGEPQFLMSFPCQLRLLIFLKISNILWQQLMCVTFSSSKHRKDCQAEGPKQFLKQNIEWALSPEVGEDVRSSHHCMESKWSMPRHKEQLIAVASDLLWQRQLKGHKKYRPAWTEDSFSACFHCKEIPGCPGR